jgi:hypothetical protein
MTTIAVIDDRWALPISPRMSDAATQAAAMRF